MNSTPKGWHIGRKHSLIKIEPRRHDGRAPKVRYYGSKNTGVVRKERHRFNDKYPFTIVSIVIEEKRILFFHAIAIMPPLRGSGTLEDGLSTNMPPLRGWIR